MILDIVQISKELFSAEFAIRTGSTPIGDIHLQGSLGSMEAEIVLNYQDTCFGMVHEHLEQKPAKRVFRPYAIYADGAVIGVVYQSEEKLGLFKGYSFREMNFSGKSYRMFSVGLGNEGYKFPIYEGERQIAEIDKPCVVYDELHEYKIYALDAPSAMTASLLCAYLYVSGAYTPGEKVIRSKVKTITITANKFLKEKYDPGFIKGMDP